MLTTFNAPTMKALRVELDEAFKAVGERHGISIVCATGRYSHQTATFKVELGVKAPDGEVVTRERSAFLEMATLFGLTPEDLGRTFTTRGKSYKVMGLKPGSPKFPIIASGPDGRTWKFPEETVKRALALSTLKA